MLYVTDIFLGVSYISVDESPFPRNRAMKNLPNKQQFNLWSKCPPGAILKVAESGHLARGSKPTADLQRRNLLVGAATAASVAVLGGVAYLAINKPSQSAGSISKADVPMRKDGPMIKSRTNFDFGGINCVEVIKLAPAYAGKTINDEEAVEKIENHLKLCQKCSMIYDQHKEI